ncbi:MAG: hypothetical protein AABX98_01890 [Nanoarchaeota archaeon]
MQYLGKVYTLSKTNTASFETFCKEENKNLENAGLKAIIQALMEWTLWQHSFIKDPLIQKKWLLENGKIVGDPEKLKITSGKKEVTLKINDGYMNSFTLKELLNIQIKKKTEEQRQAATSLAKAFVDAGIQVPQDIFIEVFQKVYQ